MHQVRTITTQEVKTLFSQYPLIEKAVTHIYKNGGRAFLVGGAVRDMVLGLSVHDLDIEVHGLSFDQLAALLRPLGEVNLVGKSFGVLKIAGTSIDWALPRTDSAGRKPEVTINPDMGIVEALRRRDLTMNALAIELQSGDFFDPFNGLEDLKQGVLRSPDLAFFKDDPLRLYRVMQFIGRFEMYPDEALNAVCSAMDISQVSRERKELEFEKLLLLSRRPSLGIRWLGVIGRLKEIAPELELTQHVEQNPSWHPEIWVFEHLMQALDAATRSPLEGEEKLILLYAALCHDLGKISTTVLENGVLRSYGHPQAGVPYTRSLLQRITQKTALIKAVELLVGHHMEPGQFVALGATLSAYRRLALKLGRSTNLQMLALLSIADRQGRNGSGHEPLEERPAFIDIFIKRAQEASSLSTPLEALLHGRDIADLVEPGSAMGALVRFAYEEQIEHGILDKQKLRELVIERIREEKNKVPT